MSKLHTRQLEHAMFYPIWDFTWLAAKEARVPTHAPGIQTSPGMIRIFASRPQHVCGILASLNLAPYLSHCAEMTISMRKQLPTCLICNNVKLSDLQCQQLQDFYIWRFAVTQRSPNGVFVDALHSARREMTRGGNGPRLRRCAQPPHGAAGKHGEPAGPKHV